MVERRENRITLDRRLIDGLRRAGENLFLWAGIITLIAATKFAEWERQLANRGRKDSPIK